MGLLRHADLRQLAAQRGRGVQLRDSGQELLKESRTFSADKTFDVFLSHSYADVTVSSADLLGLKFFMEDLGVSVYVDWIEDTALDRSQVSPATAATLKTRMRSCKSLLFAVSARTADSKWMPWELGFFDGSQKPVAIAPLVEGVERVFQGQEYLGLYPYVSVEKTDFGASMLWVETAPKDYVPLRDWIDGEVPRHHP
jgi:hypothetical protein